MSRPGPPEPVLGGFCAPALAPSLVADADADEVAEPDALGLTEGDAAADALAAADAEAAAETDAAVVGAGVPALRVAELFGRGMAPGVEPWVGAVVAPRGAAVLGRGATVVGLGAAVVGFGAAVVGRGAGAGAAGRTEGAPPEPKRKPTEEPGFGL